MRDLRWWSIGFAFCGLIFGSAPPAGAQDGGSIGVGGRIAFQRGQADIPNSSALRLLGGQLKVRVAPKTAIELSADYESSLNENLTERAKTVPVQASVLVYPVRAVVSPYVLGGLGWYNHSVTNLNPGPLQVRNSSIREMGYHAGVGAEMRAGKHLSIHGDYRYTHIRFGGAEPAAASTIAAVGTVVSLIPQLTALQQSLKMSHQGSTLNWGATFFF